MIRWIPVLACLGWVACVPPALKPGLELAERGEFEQAARAFMQQLDDDMDDAPARKALSRVARDAWEVRLDIAREAEADRRFEDSLMAYAEAERWLEELEPYGVVDWNPDGQAAREREEVEERLALSHYVDGKAAMEEERFEDAIQSFASALEVREDYEDSGEWITRAWLGWGRAQVTAGTYREAVESFENAAERGAGHEAVAWRSAVALALGRYYLEHGHCRAAAMSLRLVDRGAIRDGTVNPDAERAEACARVELVVDGFEEVAGESVGGTSLEALATDRLAHELREQGTEFVKLVDSGVLGRSGEGRPGSFYRVRGRLTQYRMERAEPTVTEVEIAAVRREVCPPPDGPYYDMTEEWCDEKTTLVYDESREQVQWRLAANIEVTDTRTGEHVLSRPIELGREYSRITRENLRRADGTDDAPRLSIERVEGRYAVSEVDRDRLGEASEELPNDGSLARDAAAELARAAATEALSTVDRPPLPPVPGRLPVEPPITDPSQLEFGSD